MNESRAKIIAELIKHLEELDAGELQAGMAPPEPEIPADVPPPVDGLPPGEMAEGVQVASDEEIDDEELEALSALSK